MNLDCPNHAIVRQLYTNTILRIHSITIVQMVLQKDPIGKIVLFGFHLGYMMHWNWAHKLAYLYFWITEEFPSFEKLWQKHVYLTDLILYCYIHLMLMKVFLTFYTIEMLSLSTWSWETSERSMIEIKQRCLTPCFQGWANWRCRIKLAS